MFYKNTENDKNRPSPEFISLRSIQSLAVKQEQRFLMGFGRESIKQLFESPDFDLVIKWTTIKLWMEGATEIILLKQAPTNCLTLSGFMNVLRLR